MAPSQSAVKRSFSTLSGRAAVSDTKRIRRSYHHYHRLREPVTSSLPEPAIADDAYVDQIMGRVIGQSLQSCGFEIADPLAVESFRDAAEEYFLRLASYVRTSMLSCRRLQPVPRDFEYALKRHRLPVNSLIPHLQPPPKVEPVPTQLPSPPPEEDDDFKILPSLEPLELSGEDDRARSTYIPKHFPEFPSKHTYRHTPVYTEREQDPRKIRERAADDGRHGEEALRKLARAAFKDNQPGSGGRDKKQWGREAESFESMFEKTAMSLSKRASSNLPPGSSIAMEIDSGPAAETKGGQGEFSGLAGLELPPIINCERDFWRRNAASGRQRPEEKAGKAGAKHDPEPSRRQLFWASLARFAFCSACRMGSHDVVSTVKPSAHLVKSATNGLPSEEPHDLLADNILYHFHQLAFLEVYRALAAYFLIEVLDLDVDMIWELFDVEKLLQEVHEEGLNDLLHDLRALCREQSHSTKTRFSAAPIDELLGHFWPIYQPLHHASGVGEHHAADALGDDSAAVEHDSTHVEVPIHPAFPSRPHPVLEISSTASAAGKSQMLYYLTAIAVLPSELNGISLGGLNSAVVFIDTDGRFDAARLRTVARGIVLNKLRAGIESGTKSQNSAETILLESLQHVHVFRPQSSLALLATLQTLDEYLLNISRHASASRALQAVVLDSATAFFWQDKLQDEIARTEDIGQSAAEIERRCRGRETFHLADIYADLVASLKRLQSIFDCTVIYTATPFGAKSAERPSMPYGSYNPLDTALNTPSFRSPLPPPWGLFPTLRLVLQREMVRPFMPGGTVQEAERDAPMRQGVVMRGEFLGSVNSWGREDWPQRILEALKRRGGGQFTFNVGQEGVTFP
ncbi:hypothetical protein BDW74DRAFT_170561 [Aspergillus multicolor]|uniref:uncharacterized protein n=1 Tax=Aspergillus multicolor TaxID=41759 RepID=UPI003CCCCE0D